MVKKEPETALLQIQKEANPELLTTKLAPPRLHSRSVPRPGLLARLDAGIERKLTLISTPAGFGKSTLVSEWIAYRRNQPEKLPIAWVSLDAWDNDLVRFWRYVLTASKIFHPAVSNSALDLLDSSPPPSIQAILTLFINELVKLPSKAVLVLEDYHAITAPQVHESITFFIDHLPPTLHLILIARSDPPLTLARLRAGNELYELRADDLRFSLEEVQAFLDQALPFTLQHSLVVHLAQRTEGWGAGLRLVSLALQRQGDERKIEQFLDTFTGSHRPLMEYFLEDAFRSQAEPIQLFLLQTSVLSRLNGSLCDAVMERDDSAQILEKLERDNLFLVVLDASQKWYRFHPLFAEAMQHLAQQRLGEIRLCELSRVASIWYEAHGMLAEAVEAALSAREYSRAADLIGRVIAPRLVQNEYHTLRRWIAQIPEEVLRAYPAICMMNAAALLFTSDRRDPLPFELIQHSLRMAEEQWKTVEDKPKLGSVLAFRAILAWRQGDYPRSFVEARLALQLLPEEEVQWRGSSLIFAGFEEMFAGKLNAARSTFTQAKITSEAARNFYATINSTLSLGEVYAHQGALRQAVQLFQQVLADLENSPMDREDSLIRQARAVFGLGSIYLEWNDLEIAGQYASRGLEIADQVIDESVRVNITILMARLRAVREEIAQAQLSLIELAAQTINPLLLRMIQAQQAWLALRAGDLITVQRWRDNLPQAGSELMRLQREMEALVEARLLMAQGNADDAHRLLETWLSDAQEQGRMRSVLEITILLALAYAALDRLPQARQKLVEALSSGQPEGFQRIFLDEGQDFAKLLQANLSSIEGSSLMAYTRALRYSLAQEQQAALAKLQPVPLTETLSEQELRVLRLLTAGLSTPDIARQLVISTNTAKTHLKNIYGKLGVNSRHQASETARQLKIFR